MTKISYSQNLSITETQRDSIYSKIIRGNEAIQNNVVLRTKIAKRDSAISLQKEVISVQLVTIELQDINTSNLYIIISNKDEEITNEKKIGKLNKRKSFLKGGVTGVVATIIGMLIIN